MYFMPSITRNPFYQKLPVITVIIARGPLQLAIVPISLRRQMWLSREKTRLSLYFHEVHTAFPKFATGKKGIGSTAEEDGVPTEHVRGMWWVW